MKNKIILIIVCIFCIQIKHAVAQNSYSKSILTYQQEYVQNHEVVLGKDKQYFAFFKPNIHFKIKATAVKVNDSIGFIMKTSGTKSKKFYRYAELHFKIDAKQQKLIIYSSSLITDSSQIGAYLFLPFTDNTSGIESYGGGRYLDFKVKDIQNHSLIIDFNKAYNPYCVYATGYNCPIPLRENHLNINITAGEKMFKGKKKERVP
jgi:uncharacterized protein (DUF1684 family)